MELPIYRSFPMRYILDLLWWARCKVALTRPDLESLIERKEIDSSERPILLNSAADTAADLRSKAPLRSIGSRRHVFDLVG